MKDNAKGPIGGSNVFVNGKVLHRANYCLPKGHYKDVDVCAVMCDSRISLCSL